MKRFLQVMSISQNCRFASVQLGGVGYTIFSMLTFGLGRGVANYYIMRDGSTTPVHCYTSVVACNGLSPDLVDLLFQRDLAQHGIEMIDFLESVYSKNKES